MDRWYKSLKGLSQDEDGVWTDEEATVMEAVAAQLGLALDSACRSNFRPQRLRSLHRERAVTDCAAGRTPAVRSSDTPPYGRLEPAEFQSSTRKGS